MSVKRLLVVDNAGHLGAALGLILPERGYEILVATVSPVKFRHLSQFKPDVLLVNTSVAAADRYAFLYTCDRVLEYRGVIIVLNAEPFQKPELKKRGVHGFLDIPFALDDLIWCINGCLSGDVAQV